MKENKRVWIVPFRHVVPADLEAYLEEQSAQGWHADKLGQWSSILMKLRHGEPKQYRYVYDMQPFPGKGYRATYEQFGWEFIGQMASSFIWRKEYAGERPEAFTDPKSIEERNKRNMRAASVSFWLFLAGALAVLFAQIIWGYAMSAEDRLELWLMLAFLALLTGLMGLALRRIRKNIHR